MPAGMESKITPSNRRDYLLKLEKSSDHLFIYHINVKSTEANKLHVRFVIEFIN